MVANLIYSVVTCFVVQILKIYTVFLFSCVYFPIATSFFSRIIHCYTVLSIFMSLTCGAGAGKSS